MQHATGKGIYPVVIETKKQIDFVKLQSAARSSYFVSDRLLERIGRLVQYNTFRGLYFRVTWFDN